MCGFYGHGFYWQKEKDYHIIFDFEINAHSRIKEYRQIPEEAIPCGFDPIDGTAVSNSQLSMPQTVKEKIEIIFQAYFPNRVVIANWIRKNYGKNYDVEEWEDSMLVMLSTEGIAKFLGQKRCIDESKWRADRSKRLADESKECADRSKWYADVSKWYTDESKQYTDTSNRYTDESKRYAEASRRLADKSKQYADASKIASTTRPILQDNYLEDFIKAFELYSNSYWADKIVDRKVEYKQFVEA